MTAPCPQIPEAWEKEFFGQTWMEVFRRLGKYSNTKEDCAKLLKLVKVSPPARILDIPCGFGRFAGILSEEGYEVVGVDSNSFLLEIAGAENPGPTYLQGDMRTPPGEAYSLVLNLWTSFGYYSSVVEDLKALKAWREVLVPGGTLVMEISDLERAQLENPNGEQKITYKKREFEGVTEEAWIDWVSQEASIAYTLDGTRLVGRTRIYSKEQLLDLLNTAGYSSVEAFRGFSRTGGSSANRLVILARR